VIKSHFSSLTMDREAEIKQRVGDRVRELRIASEMTSIELSSRAGISQGQLSKIENGKATISIKMLAVLCEILGRPVSYLFQREAEMPRVLGTLNTVQGPESQGIQWFAEEVSRLAKGRISLIPLRASQLGTAVDQVEQLTEGIIDLFIESLSYYHLIIPSFQIFALPYAFHTPAHQQAFLTGDFFRHRMQAPLKQQGIRFLNRRWNWIRGLQRVLVSGDPICSPDQIRGKRVRIYDSPVLAWFWRRLGAHPVVVPWPEVKNALRKGDIDVLPTYKTHVYPLRFCRYARFVTLLGDVAPVMGIGVNASRYQSLSPSIQKILETACDSAGDHFSDRVRSAEEENERLNIAQFKAVYLKVDITAWEKQIGGIRSRLIAENVISAEVFSAIDACR
jgi:TRAP-type C4-dicarboxylate transport system substrate-binding protein